MNMRKKLLVLESKTDSIIEQKKNAAPTQRSVSQGPLGSVLRSYSAKTKMWKTMGDPSPDQSAETFFRSVVPVLHSVATGGGKSVLIIACNIPATSTDEIATLRFPFPRWCTFDSHSLTVAKGEATLHNLRAQLGSLKKQKSANPALRQMFQQLEKCIQAYQYLYRFVAFVNLPLKCLQSIIKQQAIHLASNIFLENVLDLEVQVDSNQTKEITGDGVFLRELDESFGSRWKKHRALLNKEEEHKRFQIFRCSWK